MLGSILKIVLILIISYILGISGTTIVFLITFIIFRSYIGGIHLGTYRKCLFVGLFLSLVSGYMSLFYASKFLVLALLILTALFSIYITNKWVPADTKNNRIKSKKVRNTRKKQIFFILLAWGSFSIVFMKYRMLNIVLASIYGVLSSFFLTTPYGYKIVKFIDSLSLLDKGGVMDDKEF
ncbi:MAG: hypothetical protein FH751_14280 [Firmicutes bacterium]|nr:hypothetical protein [Bacillota bacterium]